MGQKTQIRGVKTQLCLQLCSGNGTGKPDLKKTMKMNKSFVVNKMNKIEEKTR